MFPFAYPRPAVDSVLSSTASPTDIADAPLNSYSRGHQRVKSYYGQVFIRHPCHRETVAGKLLLHRRLSLPGSTLPSTDQLTSPNATYSALQVLLSRVLPSLMVLFLQYVTMPARTSHEAARTTSNLSMYNESLIPHLYEGLMKVLQSYLPAPCQGLAASRSKKNSDTCVGRYAPPVTRAEVNGLNALYLKNDCA